MQASENNSKKILTAIFFCGHKSPFGRAFIEPLLNSRFRILTTVLASESRWRSFMECLTGTLEPTSNIFSRLYKGILHPTGMIKQFFQKKFRKENVFHQDLTRKGNRIMIVDNINDKNFLKKLADMNPDLIFCTAYPQIFGQTILEIPNFGSLNFHPSLLPRYRGAHPHFWVLYNGEHETGITAHYMTTEIDAGDIVTQIPISISPEMRYGELYHEIIRKIPEIVKNVEDRFFSGNYKGVPQNAEDATYFRNDRQIHHCIFWSIQKMEQIRNIVRACDGTSYCFWHGRKIFITKVTAAHSNRNVTNNIEVPNGTIVDIGNDYITVKVIDGFINIMEIIVNGKRISGHDIIRVLNPIIGESMV